MNNLIHSVVMYANFYILLNYNNTHVVEVTCKFELFKKLVIHLKYLSTDIYLF